MYDRCYGAAREHLERCLIFSRIPSGGVGDLQSQSLVSGLWCMAVPPALSPCRSPQVREELNKDSADIHP